MFYKLIQQKRDEWFRSDKCTVREVLDILSIRAKCAITQIEATLKTYIWFIRQIV